MENKGNFKEFFCKGVKKKGVLIDGVNWLKGGLFSDGRNNNMF